MSSEGTTSDPIVLIMNAFLLCFLLNQWTGKVSFSVCDLCIDMWVSFVSCVKYNWWIFS